MSEYIIATEQLATLLAKCRVNLVNADGTTICDPKEIAEAVDGPIMLKEIVRCRDCKFCYKNYCVKRTSPTVSPSEIFWIPVEPDGFCAWGERDEGA